MFRFRNTEVSFRAYFLFTAGAFVWAVLGMVMVWARQFAEAGRDWPLWYRAPLAGVAVVGVFWLVFLGGAKALVVASCTGLIYRLKFARRQGLMLVFVIWGALLLVLWLFFDLGV